MGIQPSYISIQVINITSGQNVSTAGAVMSTPILFEFSLESNTLTLTGEDDSGNSAGYHETIANIC